MDLRVVEIFCRVFEARSFSRAADSLGLSQPTVSGHIKNLERDLDCRLLDRLGRRVEPTQAGEVLYEHARRIVELKDDASAAMQRFLGRAEGRLVIGASPTPGEHWLPETIAALRERHPEIQARLLIGSNASILDGVRDGRIDVGIVGARRPDAGLAFTGWKDDTAVLAAPPETPWQGVAEVADLDVLRTTPLVVREPGSGARAALERALAQRGMTLDDCRVTAEMGSPAALVEAVRRQLGVAFVPWRAAACAREAGWLRIVDVPAFARPRLRFDVVIDARRAGTPLRDLFVALVAKS